MTANIRALRLILVVRQGEEPEATNLLKRWQEAFTGVFPEGVDCCIWVTGVDPTPPSNSPFCVHSLQLNPLIDFYQRDPSKLMPWSPWGQKSGPNFQFFAILKALPSHHPEPWVLQLELDTVPLRQVNEDDLPWLLEPDGPWVVGTSPGNWGDARESTLNHINGAAFYKVGDPVFQEFLHLGWMLGLLEAVQSRPALAYDVASSRAVWNHLSETSRQRWKDAENRFRVTDGMKVVLPPAGVDELTNLPNPPWFAHLLRTLT